MARTIERRTVLTAAAGATLSAGLVGGAPAIAQSRARFRLQSQQSEASFEGRALAKFARICQSLSGGRLEIEMHYSSSIVKEFEAFEATRKGIIDGDCTSPTFITGKEPAFQFFGDLLGGYEDPSQIQAWYAFGGGRAIGQELYNEFGTQLVGLFFVGLESLVSTKPLRGMADVKEWRFRCPPGMQTEIFTAIGAKPVVMPFTEVFTALSTGVVDGCDASVLNLNRQLGLYDVAKHTTFPGFHSMPSNHLNINKRKWDALPDDLKLLMESAYTAAMQEGIQQNIAANATAAADLRAKGVTLHRWGEADLRAYSAASRAAWRDWSGRSALAKKAVDSHVAFLTSLGLIS